MPQRTHSDATARHDTVGRSQLKTCGTRRPVTPVTPLRPLDGPLPARPDPTGPCQTGGSRVETHDRRPSSCAPLTRRRRASRLRKASNPITGRRPYRVPARSSPGGDAPRAPSRSPFGRGRVLSCRPTRADRDRTVTCVRMRDAIVTSRPSASPAGAPTVVMTPQVACCTPSRVLAGFTHAARGRRPGP